MVKNKSAADAFARTSISSMGVPWIYLVIQVSPKELAVISKVNTSLDSLRGDAITQVWMLSV